ncbi:MFS transporter [Bacillus sp. ISL-4]|uniref:MFS transporter n=1 Tax=Bacillus sp. ISL-4 TaxID=2819125 RepID=UPI001BE90B6E|nr:MFS transporter [Bacillus sp. ISL-4]MBT2669145.1 MFS transporter [Bacillus sp. ISL-4]MBT2674633.1 MFS transporter [Streptomyces sp. ISL-14]
MRIPNARWYRIGLLLFLIYLAAFMDRSNIGMAAPLIVKSLGVSSTAIGVVLSAFFWGYVITQVPGGWAAGKYSAKNVIVISLVVLGISAICTGLIKSFDMLLFFRFVMGLAEGVLWPAFSIFFVNWYLDKERAKAVNFAEMALPISSIIMAPLAGWMITQWDYHTMFILQGAPPLILAILFAWLAADSPEKDKRLSKVERDYLVENRSTVIKEKGSFLDVIKNYRVWVFSFIYFLWITGVYSFGLWMPSLIKQLSNSGIGAVGWMTAIPFVLAAVFMYINSVWSDHVGKNRVLFVSIPLMIGGIALAAEHFISGGLVLNMVLLIIAGIGIYSAFGPWWAWAMSFFPDNQAGTANGLINMCGNIGGIVGPIVVGAVAEGSDLSNGFYVLGYFLMAGSILALVFGVVLKSKNEATGHNGISETKGQSI